ncbi:MAG: DUF4998 domain-containing protein [Mangrovibacterium sp.]
MQKIRNIKDIILWSGFLFIWMTGMFYLTACSEMDHTYEHFWKDGERVYPAPADSVRVYSGKNRIALSWLIFGDPNVSKAKIYWNYEKDSLEVPIQSTGKGDTIKAMLSGMEERSYAFTIYTYDNQENRSIPVSAVGRVYGELYENSLLTRLLKSAFYTKGSLVLDWGDPADATSIGSELVYQNTEGITRTVSIATDADSTIVKDYDFHPDATFSYRTVYVPDSMAIDTFYTAFTTVKVKGPTIDLSKSGWTATASSFDSRSGSSYRPPVNTIDGKTSTVWVNQISPQTYYPHTLTVDMGHVVEGVDGISVLVQKRNETPKSIEVQISTNGTEWSTIGLYSVLNIANTVQYFDFPESQDIRYFKIVAITPTGATDNVVIVEVGAYTR